MLTLHPEILSKDGKKQFAVLPYEEFVALQSRLEDADDLLELRKARRAEEKKSLFLSRRSSAGWDLNTSAQYGATHSSICPRPPQSLAWCLFSPSSLPTRRQRVRKLPSAFKSIRGSNRGKVRLRLLIQPKSS